MPGPKTLEERLEELEKKFQSHDHLQELGEEREAQRAKEDPVMGEDQDGFFLRLANRAFGLRFGGYAQVDGRFYFGDTAQSNVTNTFEVRRFRPIFQGTLYLTSVSNLCRILARGKSGGTMGISVSITGPHSGCVRGNSNRLWVWKCFSLVLIRCLSSEVCP